MATIEELVSRGPDGLPTGQRAFVPFDPEAGMRAEEASKQATTFQRIMSARRKTPAASALTLKMRAENRPWIYNVGPWPHTRQLGALGDFTIPACPDGAEYVRMEREIPWDETVVRDEQNMELREEQGMNGVSGAFYNAQQIVGVGAFMPPMNNLEKKGVFIGTQVGPHAKPTDAEIAQARNRLNEYLESLVAEARRAAERGPKAMESEITDIHHTAARMLNLDPRQETWMSRKMGTGTNRQACPKCRQIADIDAVMCATPGCGFIFDGERFVAIEKEQAEIRQRARAK